MSGSRVFNIPASAPFLPTLVRALLDGKLIGGFPKSGDPLELARLTLYLPTRRAVRLARDAFLEANGGQAAILPRLVPLGHVDEAEIGFSQSTGSEPADLDIPEALGDFQRNITLARLILEWARQQGMQASGGAALVANTPAAAFRLAGDLARLMDDMATRQVPWSELDTLVPEEFDKYWEKTLKFLKIAREAWPKFLADNNLIEPAVRQNLMIAAEAARLTQSGAPVIAAGSTGSIPATAALLETIAKLPNGAVVLPGLDIELDDESWEALGGKDAAPSHPQYAMQALLKRFAVPRAEVTQLAPAIGRELLVSEAMRPAAQSERWHTRLDEISSDVSAGMEGIAVIEAASAEDEALAIAVALRKAVDEPAATAALITPDRALARRVAAALLRWNIETDDSAGDDLANAPAGVFARLIAEATLDGLPPVPLLAMLKHPLCKLDATGINILERAILRGPRPKSGSAGLAHALKTFRPSRKDLHRNEPNKRITDDELDAADVLVRTLAEAIAPLETLPPGSHSFAAIARHHREVIEALAGEQDVLAAALDEIADHGGLTVERSDYAELFHAALASYTVRKPPMPARIRIVGTLESRLQNVDRVVLGGLAEGVWPPDAGGDPWLSRPMRAKLGLDLPERRIGLSAHDFAQALGANEVVLSRAARIAGAPTVASRFVQRLAAIAGEPLWKQAVARGEEYLALARKLDDPVKVERIAMPEPRPPVAARPKQLSVTDIENWLRDPYTIYAKHVLRLFPLNPVNTPPGAADRGTIIHGAVGDFAKAHPDALPADALAQLTALGTAHFAPLQDFPEAQAFWWPRFLRIAQWLVDTFEPERRANIATLYAEQPLKLPITIGASTFTLTARADRFEKLKDGSYAILDFKTGAPPTEPQVRTGLSPQLTLEAAMLRGGAFKDIAEGANISQLIYVVLRGGDPPGLETTIKFKDGDANSQADNALQRLIGVAAKFMQLDTPFRPLAHPMWAKHYGEYDHLARVREWSQTGGVVESGE